MNLSERERPLLSICIPTYNRAEYLRGALENITSDPEFDNRVEVVISDNASPDNTQEVGVAYANRFPNIKYFRNETNVRDENFKLAFQRASGKYLKLFNDTLRLNPGSLKKILEILTVESRQIPLFVQKINFIDNNNCTVTNVHELLQSMSFYITWIVNFGIWKNNINYIYTDSKYTRMRLPQVSWYLNLIQYNTIMIHYDDWFTPLYPDNKGGYNIFEIFLNNYVAILLDYNISNKIISQEKKYLLKHFLSQYIISKIIKKPIGNFNYNGMWRILFKHYKSCPYFYTIITFNLIKSIIRRTANKIGKYSIHSNAYFIG